MHMIMQINNGSGQRLRPLSTLQSLVRMWIRVPPALDQSWVILVDAVRNGHRPIVVIKGRCFSDLIGVNATRGDGYPDS